MKEETSLPTVSSEDNLPALNNESLNTESVELLNKIISEHDTSKTKELVDLFNTNQTKKTMVRVNRLGELLDTITEQTIIRYTTKPNEITNQELLQGLRVAQDIVERGQRQIAENKETSPLIQVNQQNNEINLSDGSSLSKESRDKVKSAVMAILAGLQTPTTPQTGGSSATFETTSSEITEDTDDR